MWCGGIEDLFYTFCVFNEQQKFTLFWWTKSHCTCVARRGGACSGFCRGWRAQDALAVTSGSFLNHLPLPLLPFLFVLSISAVSHSFSSLSLFSFSSLFFLLSSTEQELNKTYEHKFAITRKTQSPEMSCVYPNPGFDTDLLYFIDNFNRYIIEFSFVLLLLHVVISIFLDNPHNCDS